MVWDKEVMMEMVLEVIIAVGHWNDNDGGCNILAVGMGCNDDGEGNEMAGEGNIAGGDQVLNMVVGLVMECIIIDYLGHRHCLLVLFMDLSKR
jgi:hypothetical protein